MNKKIVMLAGLGSRSWCAVLAVLLIVELLFGLAGGGAWQTASAQEPDLPGQPDQDSEARFWFEDSQIESGWQPDYLGLATGSPGALAAQQGMYKWPLADGTPFTISHVIQSYQYYGGRRIFTTGWI